MEKKEKPKFRVVQTDKDENNKTVYKSVGAMWEHTSKDGKRYYVLSIGALRLLVFPVEDNQ